MTLFMSDGFALRPIFDELVAEIGDPPTGLPDELQFHWPDEAPDVEQPAYFYVGDSQ